MSGGVGGLRGARAALALCAALLWVASAQHGHAHGEHGHAHGPGCHGHTHEHIWHGPGPGDPAHEEGHSHAHGHSHDGHGHAHGHDHAHEDHHHHHQPLHSQEGPAGSPPRREKLEPLWLWSYVSGGPRSGHHPPLAPLSAMGLGGAWRGPPQDKQEVGVSWGAGGGEPCALQTPGVGQGASTLLAAPG